MNLNPPSRQAPTLQRSQVEIITQATAPQAHLLLILWTPLSPAIKMFPPPPASPPARCHLPRSAGVPTLRCLMLAPTATCTAHGVPNCHLEAPNCHLEARRTGPPLCMTEAHEARAVTWRGVPLRVPQLPPLTTHLGPPPSNPPTTCWAPTTTAPWAAGHLDRTEAPRLCRSIIRCPARSPGILVISIVVSGCSYPG